MTRVDTIRSEVRTLIKANPFRPFALSTENGDRIMIEHPENIAFDPGTGDTPGSEEFYAISSKLRVFSNFSAVTSVAMIDRADV